MLRRDVTTFLENLVEVRDARYRGQLALLQLYWNAMKSEGATGALVVEGDGLVAEESNDTAGARVDGQRGFKDASTLMAVGTLKSMVDEIGDLLCEGGVRHVAYLFGFDSV